MDLPPDFKDLLAEFASADVACVIVGGYAVAFHGRPRATKDIDVLLEASPENLARAATAAARFGAPANVVSALRTMSATDVVFLGQPPLRIDFLSSIDGVPAADVFAAAADATIEDLTIRVISLDHLIANKRAVARRQDLIDVEFLERVRAKAATR